MSDEARLKARIQKLIARGEPVTAEDLASILEKPKKRGRKKHLRIPGFKPRDDTHKKVEIGRMYCELFESGKSRQQAYRAVRREIRIWRSESYLDKCAKLYRDHREGWEALRRMRQETHDWFQNNDAHSFMTFFDEERQRQLKMIVKGISATYGAASTLYENSDGITE